MKVSKMLTFWRIFKKTMAVSLRGSAWFGMVDILSEAKLVKKIVCYF
jgi:hypothetical protein